MLPPAPATFVQHDVLHRVKRSAGGVIWRRGPEGAEVALVHKAGRPPGRWSFPKGSPLPGETSGRTAVREVIEETGYRVRPNLLLGSLARRSRRGRSKLVTYWLMTVVEGRFRPSAEIDDLAWVTLGEALRLLAGRPEAALLPALSEALSEELAVAG